MTIAPGRLSKLSARVQKKINAIIPEKVHKTLTVIVKKMVEAVLFTSEFIKPGLSNNETLETIEQMVEKRVEYYRSSAAVEGGVAGLGGFMGSLADFPALMAIKLKFLFDVAALYGYDTSDLKERVFLLHIFQLAFSHPVHRADVYSHLVIWSVASETIPNDIHSIDWQNFQQQYRDYLDLAKLAQMMPGIGAAVGLVVNYRLLNQLGTTAMMCYRLRWFSDKNNHA